MTRFMKKVAFRSVLLGGLSLTTGGVAFAHGGGKQSKQYGQDSQQKGAQIQKDGQGLGQMENGMEEERSVGAAATAREQRTDLATGKTRGDRALENNVRMTLLSKLGAEGLRIHTEAVGTQVWLTGTVKERASQKLAEEVVKSVEGVKEVRNDIKLRTGKEAYDEKTDPYRKYGADARSMKDETKRDRTFGERAVNDAILEARASISLARTVGDDAAGIQVEAVDGVVSVRGTVGDETERKQAIADLKTLPGTKNVIDLLKVKGS